MNRFFLTAVAVMVSVNSWAQFLPAGYLTDETRLKDYAFILPPPSSTDGAITRLYHWPREIAAQDKKDRHIHTHPEIINPHWEHANWSNPHYMAKYHHANGKSLNYIKIWIAPLWHFKSTIASTMFVS